MTCFIFHRPVLMNQANNLRFALVLTGLAIVGCRATSAPPPLPEEQPPAVQIMRPEPGDIALPAFSGITRPDREFVLSFQLAGRVQQRLVEQGDYVAAGQPLFRLDRSDLELQLSRAETALSTASENLKKLNADLKRTRQLHQRGLAADSELDELIALQTKANSDYSQATSTLQLARNQVSYAELVSPVDGHILAVKAESESIVSPGQAIVILASGQPMTLDVDLPESWLPPPNHGFAEFHGGKIYEISLREPPLQADPATRTWRARYTVDGQPPDGFGRQVQVRFSPPAVSARFMSLPISALDERGGGPQIWLIQEDKALPAPIELHQILPDRFIFSSSVVNQTDIAAVAGTHRLHAGISVRTIESH